MVNIPQDRLMKNGQRETNALIGSSITKSPRGNVRMLHNINHRFVRMWKPTMAPCSVCQKPLNFNKERCTYCKVKVHTHCKSHVGPTCGMTAECMRQMFELLVGNEDSWSQDVAEKSLAASGHEKPPYRMSTSVSNGYLNAMPDRFDSASSSSCNSSTPSTPAPVYPNIFSSPGLLGAQRTNFPFPDISTKVAEISIESQLRPSVSVENDENRTLRQSQEGSCPETGSEQTLSPDDNLVDSVGSGDSSFSGHQWRRDIWSMSTIRGASTSWREWTIPIEEIQFKKDSLIGRGRFGEVHQAYWHQDVAVKLLNMDHVEDERQLEAFKQEVSTFRNTRHENLILFLGCCLKPPKLGIVMNLCKGRTLHTILYMLRERLDIARIINIGIQISQGMSYLHGKKIIHKDLRTKNIFLENNNKVVITDFGLFSIHRLCKSTSHDCTRLHMPEHWLCYLAPEIMRVLLQRNANGEIEELPFSFTTDVYAFGTVWFELICDEFPFKRYPPEAIIWQVGKGIKPAMSNIQVMKEVKELCLQCWCFKADDRPNFNQVLKIFEKLPRKPLARSPSFPIHASRSAESVF